MILVGFFYIQKLLQRLFLLKSCTLRAGVISFITGELIIIIYYIIDSLFR